MGLRFRNRARVFPGVWINFNTGMPSISIGRPGATLNIGKTGLRGTVGLPGSGLSYSEHQPWPKDAPERPGAARPRRPVIGLIARVALSIAALLALRWLLEVLA